MFAWISMHKILALLFATLILIVILVAFPYYINNEIVKAIRTEASNISQCKVMPVGHKSCGGPAGYIVYSTETSDIDRYIELVATRDKFYAILQGLFKPILGSGGWSTCNFEMPRKVEFANGKCFFSGR